MGKELVGMLVGSSAHPARALRLIHELHLCKPIFLPPLQQPIFKGDGTVVAVGDGAAEDEVWNLGYSYAAKMYELVVAARTETATAEVAADASKMSEDEQSALKVRILASFLLPLADHYVMEKRRQVALPSFIIRELLKVCVHSSLESFWVDIII